MFKPGACPSESFKNAACKDLTLLAIGSGLRMSMSKNLLFGEAAMGSATCLEVLALLLSLQLSPLRNS